MKPSHEALLQLRDKLDHSKRVLAKWNLVRDFVENYSGGALVFSKPHYAGASRSYYVEGSNPLYQKVYDIRFLWFPDYRRYEISLKWEDDLELMETLGEVKRWKRGVPVRWVMDSEGMLNLAQALLGSEEVGV